MVTRKKRAIEYTQKEMRRTLKSCTTKNPLRAKEDGHAGNEGQKSHKMYRKQTAK